MATKWHILQRMAVLRNHIQARALSSSSSSPSAFSYPRLPHVIVHKDRAEAEVIVPGYSYGDLDRNGFVKPWRTALLPQGARAKAFEHPNWWPGTQLVYWWSNHLHPDLRTLMVASQYTYTPEFYDTNLHLFNPLHVTVHLVKAGKSSYQLYEETRVHVNAVKSNDARDDDGKNNENKVKVNGQGQLIHTSSIHYVTANTQSGRPCEIPAAFRELFVGPVRNIDRVPYVTPPKNAASVSYQCQPSDMDLQHHVNQAQYLRFALNAATTLAQRGTFSKLTGDLAKLQLKSCTNLFLGESFPEQVLNISVWESTEDPWVLHVHMERDGKAVFQAKLEYYDTENHK